MEGRPAQASLPGKVIHPEILVMQVGKDNVGKPFEKAS
jgi:hypothetical protein